VAAFIKQTSRKEVNMNEREPNNNEHQEDQGEHEQEPKAQPRIYVASLADYNEGRLHGAWIDAAQSAEELEGAVKAMLDDSPSPGAEEWAIHDYEGFGLLHLDEFDSMESVASVAAGITEHGPAFAAWAAHVGADSEHLGDFHEAYMGEWESGKAFAEEMLADLGEIEELERVLPKHLAPYIEINYGRYFGDLVSGGDIIAVEKRNGGLYVFWNW
jgi:antirestriction protein